MSGSYNGGTLINIKGINFAPNILETLVFVGDAINWQCNVESVTKTDIFCRTPPINPNYNISKAQPITLTNRIVVDATCSTLGNCQFTYMAASVSPQISSLSASAVISGIGTLTINGFNFGSGKVMLTNKLTNAKLLLSPKTMTTISATIALPLVEAGFY